MSISLQKPNATDIYDIGVFNSNTQIIEDAVNMNIINIQDNIQNIAKKLDAITVESSIFTLDTVLESANYYILVSPKGTLPSGTTGKGILISQKDKTGNNLQILITSLTDTTTYNIFTRTVSSDTSFTAWQNLTASVVDSLDSTSTVSALSANQGKILKDTKLNLVTPENIPNIDDLESGIYICNNNTKISGCSGDLSPLDITIDGTGKNDCVIVCYRDTDSRNITGYQSIYDCHTQTSLHRYATDDNLVDFWDDWLSAKFTVTHNDIANNQLISQGPFVYATDDGYMPEPETGINLSGWHTVCVTLTFGASAALYNFIVPVIEGHGSVGGYVAHSASVQGGFKSSGLYIFLHYVIVGNVFTPFTPHGYHVVTDNNGDSTMSEYTGTISLTKITGII